MSGSPCGLAGGFRPQGIVLLAAFTIAVAACASVPRATTTAASTTTSRRFEGCVYQHRWPNYPAFDVNVVFLGNHILIPAAALDTVNLNNFAGRKVIMSANVRAGTDTLVVTHIEPVPGQSCRML
ncbi:MAG: hypothetical protein ACREOJ_16145 [Gemmatimonadaceae bacterium]